MRFPTALPVSLLLLLATMASANPSTPAAGASASNPAIADSDSALLADPDTDADLDFPVVLGSFSTTLLGSLPARTQNIRLAAAKLDRQVLEPGAELSFNATVGPRTTERGYAIAPVILREQRQLQLGGGICQVASTVFDAALIAGLTPVERYRHSSPVDYVALGEDATIAWGYKDLKLRNDGDAPVRLRVEIVGGTLLARFEGGSESESRYDLVAAERDVPASTDANLPGHEVELYRVRLVDGREVERELLHRDLYPSARMAGR